MVCEMGGDAEPEPEPEPETEGIDSGWEREEVVVEEMEDGRRRLGSDAWIPRPMAAVVDVEDAGGGRVSSAGRVFRLSAPGLAGAVDADCNAEVDADVEVEVAVDGGVGRDFPGCAGGIFRGRWCIRGEEELDECELE